MLSVPKLRPEWGKGAISQNGQVTILDLPKAHGITDMEVITLQPCTFYSLSLQMLEMMENSNLTSLEKGWQGNTIAMVWSTFWVHPSEQILRKLSRSM